VRRAESIPGSPVVGVARIWAQTNRPPGPSRSASLKQRSLVKPRAHSAGLLCHWRRVRVHASLDTRTDEANGLTCSKSTRHYSGMNHRHVAFARWTLWRTFCCPARFQRVIQGVSEIMEKGFVDAYHPEKFVSTHRCAPAWSAWSGMVDDGVGRYFLPLVPSLFDSVFHASCRDPRAGRRRWGAVAHGGDIECFARLVVVC
jgi:hypothetical protein